MKNNSLALVIQARMGSSRFPGKPICDLCGATLLERIFQRVKKVKKIGKVILATTKKKEDSLYFVRKRWYTCIRSSSTVVLQYCSVVVQRRKIKREEKEEVDRQNKNSKIIIQY